MLSGVEKLRLAKEIRQLRKQIKGTSLKGVEKLSIAKQIKQIRSQIVGSVAKLSSRLEELINGKFDHFEPMKFITIVREISEESGEFESVKQPVVNYVEKRLTA
ncbi:TPA: hypothetical protein ACMDRZ_003072 [Vibrio cholerae]|uniref:Uncharacterized protein n=1 Tax=Vibrio vulnificus TaxID=672 RepID=A0AAI9ELX7_VIBVL|nr:MULTISPECIES: hypothetical protein [Vibrio]EHU8077716.1 hypothetical protein [Vibrio cholerae]EHV9953772.1 hypothetical protein [Vibrio cholerae]EKF9218996.1 hypothetical protein [Vibrio cholerae]MEB5557046.1 hypothetical protein [Vibrio cholerae]OQK43753.1 hypothetical protein XM75_u0034 [Vibrio vulnificus]